MRAIGLVASIALIGVASADQCPAAFQEFIGAFESSAEFQVAHSKYPLTYPVHGHRLPPASQSVLMSR